MIETTATPVPTLTSVPSATPNAGSLIGSQQQAATLLAQLGDRFVLFLPTILVAILIFVLFWFAARLAARLIRSVGKRMNLDLTVRDLLADGTHIVVIIVGAITALGTVGIDVSALVAGLGLTSFALGLALKDIVSNVVSGVLILTYHPFRIGDTVSVSGSEGVVIDVNLRYTILRAAGKIVLIPNQNVFSNVVIVDQPIPPSQES